MQQLFKPYRYEYTIFLFFILGALLITLLHLLYHPVRILGMDTSIFYMDEKYTLAAFFSTITSFLVGFIVLTNVKNIKPKFYKLANWVYGLFFIILAFDEYFEVHEYTNTVIKASLEVEGVIKELTNLTWMFPLSIIILAVFILLSAKIKLSDKVVKKPLIIGTICFLVVLVFELLGSLTYGRNIYLYSVAVEEGFEMLGVSFFLLAALIETSSSDKKVL